MRDDFCAFILTHGRPDKVLTYRTLRRAGYTGKIFIVVDDEDKTRHQYMAEFGEQVLVFSKADIASRFDEADNFSDRRSIFYARNACFDQAKLVGCKYFIQLDDDYHEFQFRVDRNYDQAYFPIRKLDEILSEMLAYYESIPALSIAMSQGGDFLGDNGGHASWVKRKAMNSFICSVDRPFSFMGRINEDVNTYTNLGRCGELFMTIGAVQLGQKQTQKNSGGMTELYLDSGNGNETPMFVAQGNQIFMNDVFLKRLTAPTITSGGSPPVFSLTSDGKLTAKNADISGSVNANSGTLNNVTINENCQIKGKLSANQIEGDIVKTVSKSFPRTSTYASGTITVRISDDQKFDRQVMIPPVLFRGGKHENFNSNNQQSYWYSTCRLRVTRNGQEIFNQSTTDAQGVFSSVIDMPAGQGTLTLTFTVSSSGANNWTPTTSISDLLVVVMKKSTAGISIS